MLTQSKPRANAFQFLHTPGWIFSGHPGPFAQANRAQGQGPAVRLSPVVAAVHVAFKVNAVRHSHSTKMLSKQQPDRPC